MSSQSPPKPEHDYQTFVFASPHDLDLKNVASKRLIQEGLSENKILPWTEGIRPFYPVEEPSALVTTFLRAFTEPESLIIAKGISSS